MRDREGSGYVKTQLSCTLFITLLTMCFGHCGPSLGHKMYKEGTIQCMFISKVQIVNFQLVESLQFALYHSLFIHFVT